jgi:hypothetical protein
MRQDSPTSEQIGAPSMGSQDLANLAVANFDSAGVPLHPVDIVITCAHGSLTDREYRLHCSIPRLRRIQPHSLRPFGPAAAFAGPMTRSVFLNHMNPALEDLDPNHDGIVVVYLESHWGCLGVLAAMSRHVTEDELANERVAQMSFLQQSAANIVDHVSKLTGLRVLVITGLARVIGNGNAQVTAGPVVHSVLTGPNGR